MATPLPAYLALFRDFGLAKLGNKAAIKRLINLCSDGDENLSVAAGIILVGRLGTKSVIEQIAAEIEKRPERAPHLIPVLTSFYNRENPENCSLVRAKLQNWTNFPNSVLREAVREGLENINQVDAL